MVVVEVGDGDTLLTSHIYGKVFFYSNYLGGLWKLCEYKGIPKSPPSSMSQNVSL